MLEVTDEQGRMDDAGTKAPLVNGEVARKERLNQHQAGSSGEEQT